MFTGTTIVALKQKDSVAMAGDGQVTMGDSTVIKHTAKKIRRIYNGKVAVGIAGSVADALTLSEKFEEKLEQYGGNLKRASVELAQDWRRDKYLKKLDALMIAADKSGLLVISGNGEVIEPDENLIAIGSGGFYAYAAAKALMENTDLPAGKIAYKAIEIAASICVYTNNNITLEEL